VYPHQESVKTAGIFIISIELLVPQEQWKKREMQRWVHSIWNTGRTEIGVTQTNRNEKIGMRTV